MRLEGCLSVGRWKQLQNPNRILLVVAVVATNEEEASSQDRRWKDHERGLEYGHGWHHRQVGTGR